MVCTTLIYLSEKYKILQNSVLLLNYSPANRPRFAKPPKITLLDSPKNFN